MMFNELFDKWLKENKLDVRVINLKLKENWPKIVGKKISNHTENVYYKSGKLYLKLNNSVLKNYLYIDNKSLINTINEYYKKEVFVEELILL